MSNEDELRIEKDSTTSKKGVLDLLESTAETMKKAQGKKFRIVLIIREMKRRRQ